MNNDNIKLANIIGVKYNGLYECIDGALLGLICDTIEQVKSECKGTEEIVHKSIKILDEVLGRFDYDR